MRWYLPRTSFSKIFSQGPYVCPDCSAALRRRQLTRSTTLSKTTCRNLTFPLRIARRTLHSTALYQNVEETVHTTLQQDVPANFSIHRDTHSWKPARDGDDPPKSFIRDQLRAWSLQKFKDDKDKIPDLVRDNNTIKVLPDSFFEEELPDEYEEDLEEYNDSVAGFSMYDYRPGDLMVVHMYVPQDIGCFLTHYSW